MRRPSVRTASAGLAVLGVLVLVLAAGRVGSTIAAWGDRVIGGSVFGVSADTGTPYARALTARGEIRRNINVGTFGPIRSVADETSTFSNAGPTSGSDGGLLGLISVGWQGQSCSRSQSPDASDCAPAAAQPTPRAYAVSRLDRTEVDLLGLLGITVLRLASYDSPGNPVTATASCRPGETGAATLTGGRFRVAGADLPIPPPNATASATTTTLTDRYTGVLRHVRTESRDQASTQL